MVDLFFSSQHLALSASACSLQRPFLDAADLKVIKKETARSLAMLAASPAPFCTQPTRQVGYMVFRLQSFGKRGSFRFIRAFRYLNQSGKNVPSVPSVPSKTAFSKKLAETAFDVSLLRGRRQLVMAYTRCTIHNHFFYSSSFSRCRSRVKSQGLCR
jgi:hypothetical protein